MMNLFFLQNSTIESISLFFIISAKSFFINHEAIIKSILKNLLSSLNLSATFLIPSQKTFFLQDLKYYRFSLVIKV